MKLLWSILIASLVVVASASPASAGQRSSHAVARPGPVEHRGAGTVQSLHLQIGEAFQVLADEIFRSSAGLRRRWQRLIGQPRIALQMDGAPQDDGHAAPGARRALAWVVAPADT